MNKKVITPEFIFIFYIFGFITLRPVLFLFQRYTSEIIACYIIGTVILSLVNKHTYKKNSLLKWIVVSALFEILLYISPNEITETYKSNFFMYGIVVLFLMLNVRDFKLVLNWIFRFSCLNGALIVLDPFFDFQFTGGYMEYGFNMFMFSFSGLLVGFYYMKKKYLFPFIIVELLMISFFGNKGACIAAILLFLSGMFFFGNDLKKFVLCIVTCFGLLNWRMILLWIIDLAKYFGVSSYSITTMQMMISDYSDVIFSARTDIWETASKWILQKPFFGYGVGVFEKVTHGYAHNIFFDVTLAFGLFGLAVFVLLLIYSVYRLYRNSNTAYKIVQGGCLLCWFVPMQISLTLWNVSLFWVYLGLCLYDVKHRKIHYKNHNI